MKKVLLVLWLLFEWSNAYAAETVWTLETETGEVLTFICYEPDSGDMYIASDNKTYEVVRIENQRVVLRSTGEAVLPDVSWLDEREAALQVLSLNRKIALYCTHSDESYEPTDGTYSDDERGSIYQIADALAVSLGDKGIETKVADTLHHPHDAGAYRRSRQTAVMLLKSTPDAIFDIHRDGIPDPKEYETQIAGKDVSKIRLLVGRGNQNVEANKDFALTVKAVADKVYPGLIKDIYMGKGAFNQDLYPRSLLFECGTYTLEKNRVLSSMPMLADVISRAMYGGVTGSAGVSDVTEQASEEKGGITQGEPDTPVIEKNEGSGRGIVTIVAIFAVGLIGFGVLSTGSSKDGMRKAGRNLSEMTGGLVGKKPDEDDSKV